MKNTALLCLLVLALAVAAEAQFLKSETAREAATKLGQGDRAGAIALLDRAIDKRKDLHEAYQMRGNIRGMMGDLDGAITDYSAALEIDPSDAQTFEKRAMYRTFKRDYAGALKDYDAAIANGSRTERNYVGRARVKTDMADFAGAIEDYESALAFNPDLAAAHVGLAQLRERQGDSDAAILVLQNFIDRYEGKRDGKLPKAPATGADGNVTVLKREGVEKDGSQAYMIGGSTTTGKFTANNAEDVEKQTAKIEQLMNVSLAFFTLGRLHLRKDALDLALVNVEKGLKMKKDDPYGHKLRSEIRMKKGDLAGTIQDLTSVVNSPMAPPDRNLDKGILLILQGRDAEAEKEFETHLKMFPAGREHVNRRIDEAKRLRSSPQQ